MLKSPEDWCCWRRCYDVDVEGFQEYWILWWQSESTVVIEGGLKSVAIAKGDLSMLLIMFLELNVTIICKKL